MTQAEIEKRIVALENKPRRGGSIGGAFMSAVLLYAVVFYALDQLRIDERGICIRKRKPETTWACIAFTRMP